VIEDSNIDRLHHGRDHTGQLSGLGAREGKPKIFFPRLSQDFMADPTLRKRYGVCVEKCPDQFATEKDYHDIPDDTPAEDTIVLPGEPADHWFVPLPSFSIFDRCIPYQNSSSMDEDELCADPQCAPRADGKDPERPIEVCGVPETMTANYWVIGKPGSYLKGGWLAHGLSQEQVDKRSEVAADEGKQETCVTKVFVNTALKPDSEHEAALLQFLTVFTGMMTREAVNLYDNRFLVFMLSGPGALVLSFIILMLFSYFARCIIPLLVLFGFVLLLCLDYVLFVQAGVFSGQTGQQLINMTMEHVGGHVVEHVDNILDDAGLSDFDPASSLDASTQLLLTKNSSEIAYVFQGCAWLLLAVILALFCMCVAFKRNYHILVALLREAATTMREMPSLLLFPFPGAGSLVFFALVLMRTMLGVATLEPHTEASKRLGDLAGRIFDGQPHEELDNGKFILMWVLIFVSCWSYALHMAVFRTTVAGAVAHWYFHRNDEDNAGTGINSAGWFFGRPVIYSMCRVYRYHWGTMVFGSCIIALATMPRLILEYLLSQTGEAEDANAMTRCLVWCVRCFVYCLEKCVKAMTDLAFVNVAISGRNLCAAGARTVELLAKYPVQMMMDKMASVALKVLACLLVPTMLVVLSFVLVPSKAAGVCALVVACNAVLITRMAVGVYDVTLTALFMCAMRDAELYDGQHAPESLRSAMDLKPKGRRTVRDVEMSSSFRADQ
jgi:choline transporter-like protein 2/4/5